MGSRPDSIHVSSVEDTKYIQHPCPKPLNIWSKLLIRGSVKESDIILDMFMGSGTTAIACIRNRRKWIGIEMSKKYCDIVVERVKDEERQLNLF
jgi:DNA modification methylase